MMESSSDMMTMHAKDLEDIWLTIYLICKRLIQLQNPC